MPADMNDLADDLAAETVALRTLVAGLDEQGWRQDTPAPGWTIADQISHLAHFDEAAIQSATRPREFTDELAQFLADGVDPDAIAERYRTVPSATLLDWFDTSRAELLTTFRALDPSVRVPWFGLHMSAASSLTARLMETWAHGQDVADALGLPPVTTPRLRHVIHIGVGARPYAFQVHGVEDSGAPILVRTHNPDDDTDIWTWGPEDAADELSGSALDLALVLTQRRHPEDTDVRAAGATAESFLSVAQAFAGPAGGGRARRGTW
jgi:uncharacterized protein (TIGR03084 family)